MSRCHDLTLHLLDPSLTQVPLGQELVCNQVDNLTYKIRWGTDESGKLCILEARPLSEAELAEVTASAVAAATAAAATPSSLAVAPPMVAATAAGSMHHHHQQQATVDVSLPDGTVMRVPVNQPYVLNPLTNQPYEIRWGTDPQGAPCVISCAPYAPEQPALPGVPASHFNIQGQSKY